jgi:hypothetical protein
VNDDTRQLVGALSGSALAGGFGGTDFDCCFLLRLQTVETNPRGEGVERISSRILCGIGGIAFFGIKSFEFFASGFCFSSGAGVSDSVSA